MMRERLLTVVEFEGSPGVVSKVVNLPTCPGTEMFAFGKLKVGELNRSSAFNWYSTRHRSLSLNSLIRLAFCTLSPGPCRTFTPELPNLPGGGATHGIHGKLISSERKRIGDRGIDFKAVLSRHAAAQIVRRELFRVHGHDFGARFRSDAVRRIAIQKATHNDGCMRFQAAVVDVHGDDRCYALLCRGVFCR